MICPLFARSFTPFFIPAECKPFVDPGVELPFEFGERPLVFPGFDLIEPALVPVVDIHEEEVMRPADGELWCQFGRQCLHNWCLRQCFGRQLPRHCLGNLGYGLMIFEIKPTHIL